MSKQNINFKSILERASNTLQKLRGYSFPVFLVFVAILYGFLIMRISSLSDAQPSPDAVTGQVKAARIPHIEESVVKQLKSLQDNSVSVKALFNEARSNPFQE